MNKHKQKKVPTIAILIVLQVIMLAWIAFLHVSMSIRDVGNERNTRQLLVTTAELRFCIDNNINPCNDVSIEQWNDSNPGNTFKKN